MRRKVNKYIVNSRHFSTNRLTIHINRALGACYCRSTRGKCDDYIKTHRRNSRGSILYAGGVPLDHATYYL